MERKSLLFSTVLVTILGIVSKILGFGRESAIGAKFGTSTEADLYVFSITITTILFSCIAQSLITTFIPMLSSYINKKEFEERNYFVNNVITLVVTLSIIMTIVGIVFAKYIVILCAPGFLEEGVEIFNLAILVCRIMFTSLVFIGVQSTLSAILQVHNMFLIPSIVSIVNNVVIIIYLITLGDKYGIVGLIISIVIAYILQLLIHIPTYKKLGYKFYLNFDLKNREIRRLLILIVPVIIGSSIGQINTLVDRNIASLFGSGNMAVLNYANKLDMLVFSIFTMSILTVLYPTLSKINIKDNKEEYEALLESGLNFINMIIIPATIGMMILSYPIVEVCFKRGEFTIEDVKTTAWVLVLYSPGIIALAMRELLNKVFYSINDTKTPMKNSILGVGINIILNIVLSKYFGVYGLAIATSISSIFTTILLVIHIKSKLRLRLNEAGITLIKILVSSFLMGIVVYICYKYISDIFIGGQIIILIKLLLSILIGIVVYIVGIILFRVREIQIIFEKLKLRISKRQS